MNSSVDDEKFLDHLYKTKENSDFSLTLLGEIFPTHKCVLSFRSSYFKILLNSGFKEKDLNSFSVKEIRSLEILKILVKSFYYSSLELTFFKGEINLDNIYDLLDIVNIIEMYDLQYLKEQVATFIKNVRIRIDTCVPFLHLFSKYNFLKSSLLSVIRENLKILIPNLEFYDFLKNKEYEKDIFEQIVLPLLNNKNYKIVTKGDVENLKNYLIETAKTFNDPRRCKEILDVVENDRCFANSETILKSFENIKIAIPDFFIKNK